MNWETLEGHLPSGAMDYIHKWTRGEGIYIVLRNSRITKLGDYRFDDEKNAHRVTIDRTLDPYVFFFVLTHELAHMSVRIVFGREIKPHGKEWKAVFGRMLMESLWVYEAEHRMLIIRHAKNPRASIAADKQLYKSFFLPEEKHHRMIENLSDNQKFRLGKKIFEKGRKRKIRYICRELKTGKLYLINGQAVADEIIV